VQVEVPGSELLGACRSRMIAKNAATVRAGLPRLRARPETASVPETSITLGAAASR
jgi:hypothetical protein